MGEKRRSEPVVVAAAMEANQSTRPLFSARRKLDPAPVACDVCGDICPYAETIVAEDTGRGGLYFYRRGLCRCEREREEVRGQKRQAEIADDYRRVIAERSGLAGRLSRYTLRTFGEHDGNREAIGAAERFLSSWPEAQGLVLYGPPGRGKTHLAAAICHEVLDRPVRAEFHKCYRLLDSLRARGDGEARTEPRVEIEHYIELPLLVIDDLGKERLTEWGQEQMFRVIDERDNLGRPLVVTSNKDPDGLVRHIGEAAVSRLVGGCEWVEMAGPDQRIEPTEKSPWWTVDEGEE